MLEKYAMIVR